MARSRGPPTGARASLDGRAQVLRGGTVDRPDDRRDLIREVNTHARCAVGELHLHAGIVCLDRVGRAGHRGPVSDTTTSANGWRWLDPILGEPVAAASPVTQPWSTPMETTVLTLGTGTRVVVQTGSDASAIAKRSTLGRLLHEVPWLLPR